VNAFNLTYDKDGNITGLGWSADSFNAGVQGGLVSAATGMTSSLTSGVLNNWSAGDNLFGFSQLNQRDVYTLNSTIGSLAGQGVNYALTGDFSVNLLNFGMFGIQDRDGNQVKNGLLELHLGKNGATMNIGMGGADVSLGTIASAMGGLAVLNVNHHIKQFVETEQLDLAVTLRSQYGFGDDVQKAQLWDILGERAAIALGGTDSEKAEAQTKREGDKRVIHINGYHEGMSREEQLRLGVTLAHEAYRNGIDDGVAGQRVETNQAVMGHIGFAAGMAGTYGVGSIGMDMALEVVAYMKYLEGDTGAMAEVLSSYDSSKDYWKVTKDKDGNILKIEDDGSNDVTFVDEYGNQTGFEEYTGGSRTEFLGKQLGISKNEANEMLKKAGYSFNSETGLFEGANAKKAFDITGKNELPVGSKEKGFIGSLKSLWNSSKSLGNELYNKITSFFDKLGVRARVLTSEKVPGDSLDFWNSAMSREVAEKYKDTKEKGPQCNNYFGDVIKYKLGEDAYARILPGGIKSANELFDQFASNPNLEVIDTSKYTLSEIQTMADSGAIVIMSYKNPVPGESGHVAFVANSGVSMFSIPQTYTNGDGKVVPIPQTGYGYNQPLGDNSVILSQAGTITGNVTMAWGTNGWNNSDSITYNNQFYETHRDYLLANFIRFYTVRSR
jgi:hypothetical protein